MLIGIMGMKRTGKDTVASILQNEHGFGRRAFADRVKDVALAVDPMVERNDRPGFETIAPLSDWVEWYGWDWAKEKTEARAVLQRLGVAVREAVGADAWIDPVIDEAATHDNFVISDVRFRNEAAAIRAAGGQLWQVTREGTPDEDTHISEHDWRTVAPDLVVWNSGDLEDLRLRAQYCLRLTELRLTLR